MIIYLHKFNMDNISKLLCIYIFLLKRKHFYKKNILKDFGKKYISKLVTNIYINIVN